MLSAKQQLHFPAVMGILNVTPDSFFDGGKYTQVEQAVARALTMFEEGAAIVDIGGESTGPGSQEVSVEEELRRVIPVIEKLKVVSCKLKVSVDTYKAEVAEQALQAGATMVNDVTAGRGRECDAEMFNLIAEAGCHYIMMRSKDPTPHVTVRNVHYDDVLATIHSFFEERLAAAERAGIARAQLILDPGLGHFVSSDPRYSWKILETLERLQDFGCPVLVSPSRKSFTARTPQEPTDERLSETLRATNIALTHGASIIRTHDVAETVKVMQRMRQ